MIRLPEVLNEIDKGNFKAIERYRILKEMSLDTLAEKIGINKTTLHYLAKGQTKKPTEPIEERIRSYFGQIKKAQIEAI